MTAESCVLCGDDLQNPLELDSGVCDKCADQRIMQGGQQ